MSSTETNDRAERPQGSTRWETNFRTQMTRLRKAHGLNQTDLARKISKWELPFHQQTIQRIEAGERPIRLNEAHVIAQVLDTTVAAMTSEVGTDERELVYAVEALRIDASGHMGDVAALASQWANDLRRLDDLISEIAEPKLERAADVEADEWDAPAVVRWAYAWLQVGLGAHRELLSAQLMLNRIVSGAGPVSIWDVEQAGQKFRADGLWAREMSWPDDSPPFDPPKDESRDTAS
ncbi:helix-turn-helix transcriptional regulator [Rhodococcus sp. USK13]|uniref:helix-turn-helix domain-containing protein n=1 Tax=Rhodococcus sp. USK13 TaxID=2806442 RepID=UPI001BCBCCC4|nr:helix-turn-helix transcriptional regulator [Rhodococcus sp. USK13]